MEDIGKLILHEDLKPEFQRELPVGMERLIEIDPFVDSSSAHSDFWLENIWKGGMYFNELSDYGQDMAEYVKGKTFLDLGCGRAGNVARTASALKAKKYIGVDVWRSNNPNNRIILESEMPAYFVQGDILNFLARRGTSDGTAFFSAGIDAFSFKNFRDYLSAVYQEMNRLAKSGDVAFSVGLNDINPEKAGFRLNGKGIYVFP